MKVHILGISGTFMSGIAILAKKKGHEVTGSDTSCYDPIKSILEKENISVIKGHKIKDIKDKDLIIIGNVMSRGNPIVEYVLRNNMNYVSGPQWLYDNILKHKKVIAVSGTHGKTTTTSLVSSIFQNTKLDPTIINGGVIKSINNTARLGKSDWSILEADESDGSFVHVPSTYSIITNIDREHMDFYDSIDQLKNSFIQFIEKAPSFGKSFVCIDDKINHSLIKRLKSNNFYTYGTNPKSNFFIKKINQNIKYTEFDLSTNVPNKKKLLIKNIKIPLLGIHNVRNAVAATAVALTIGISVKDIKKGLLNFKGVERRFSKIFRYNNIDFYDDYAHHPTEIKMVLDGVNKVYPNFEKVCIFQPHRISRLKDLKKEFSFAFRNADTVILCPIFTAGEKIKLGFKYSSFAKEIIKNSKVKLFLVNDLKQLAIFLKRNMYGKKIVIGMGAGSISSWIKTLPKLMK